jgi:dihydrofolate reductase
MERKLILYIAMSLDGFIAKHDDNIDFLSVVEAGEEDYGHKDFLNEIDTVIWGRRTFEKVVSFGHGVPYPDKKVYVISKSRKGTEGHAVFHDDASSLIASLKAEEGKHLYCDGGGEVVLELLKSQLIDRIIVSVIPHLLGEGIRLFKGQPIEQRLTLRKSTTFPSGLVQLWYDVRKDLPPPGTLKV